MKWRKGAKWQEVRRGQQSRERRGEGKERKVMVEKGRTPFQHF